MDAVTYIKEAMRMCKSAGDDCENCLAKVERFCPVKLSNTVPYKMQGNEENAVSVVEKWAKDNPIQEWIEAPDEGADGSWEACSRCAWESRWAASKYKYCPHCGARMVNADE